MEDLLLNLYNQDLANKATNLYDQRQRDLVNQSAMDVFSTGFNNRNQGILSQASGIPLYDDMAPIIDTSYVVANEPDEEEIELQSNNKFGGIMDLLLSTAIPGYGMFKNIAGGGLEGLRGFNQRLQQSDFGQSKNLTDYLDMRSYGGLRERENQAAQTMAQARGIQNKIDTGEYRRTAADDVIDRGRGDRPGGANYSAPSKPQRSFSSDYSEAQRARKF